ncbi:MAG TPA: hypothetical protein PLP29_18930 [Candidatus Ozemobacteraceae bacterium]|mgnify:CR=1 FL=1|nr:hypothetical protein [Candidatus Ozemobacteraceae bacterium]
MNRFRNAFAAALATASPGLPALPPGEEIYGLRGPAAVPFEWLPLLAKAAGLLVLCYLLHRLWRRWNDVGEIIGKEKEKPVPVDHLMEALESLDRLRASPVWQEGRVKDICESLAGILKTFIHGRCGIGSGASATTDELGQALRGVRWADAASGEVLELLGLCDEVKFARGTLATTGCDGLWSRFRNLIQREVWRR